MKFHLKLHEKLMENKQNFNVDKRISMKNCRKLTENSKTVENENLL